MGDLKVNIHGPVRMGANSIFQKAPQSATQPELNMFGSKNLLNMNQNYQPYSPSYPNFQNNLMPQRYGGVEILNQQLIHQNQISKYQQLQHIDPTQQPQSATLARKPPGFEFVSPNKASGFNHNPEGMVMKNSSVNYNEYQSPLKQPQIPYYMEHSSFVVPPSYSHHMVGLKGESQSATIMTQFPRGSLFSEKQKSVSENISQADSQEGKILEWIK